MSSSEITSLDTAKVARVILVAVDIKPFGVVTAYCLTTYYSVMVVMVVIGVESFLTIVDQMNCGLDLRMVSRFPISS